MRNHTNEGTGITGEMILELCQSHELVRYAIPEGFELLLPRFQLETKSVMDGSEAKEIHRWVVECWWRSAKKGTLGYFVKIDLLIFAPLMPNTSTRLILKKPKTDSSIRKVWLHKTLAYILREWKASQDELRGFLGDEYQEFNLVLPCLMAVPVRT